MTTAAAPRTRILRHATKTAAQDRFWRNPAKFRLFVGGIGSGKTRAGVVEVLRQPAGSTGMILAPTYDMLREATLHTFLEFTQRGHILQSYNKSDRVATLTDGKRVIFRTADDPEKLRGPNLGWFYLDEAALMEQSAWLIMIGRLRLGPGRAWATTTPRGFNWVYDLFHTDDENYAIIHSSTRENVYLPAGFIRSLETSYTSEFARQEIEGEFINPAGTLFKRAWFTTITDRYPDGVSWVRYWDLAASTKDSADYTASAAVALSQDGTLYIRDMVRGKWEWPDAKRILMQTMQAEPSVQHGVEEALHGLAAVQELQRERSIANITLRGIRVDKDKQSRALPWAARAEAGKVALVRGPWIPAFLDEVASFPLGQHDDQVDSISGAVQMMSGPSRGLVTV